MPASDLERFVEQLVQLPALRELRGLTVPALGALVGSPRYRHLGLTPYIDPPDAAAQRELLRAWAPQLRSIGLAGDDPTSYRWLWKSRDLDRIEVSEPSRTVTGSPWLTYPLPSSITELAIRGYNWHLRFARDGGAFTRLEATGGFAGKVRYSLVDALRIAPEGMLREVRVVMPRRPPAAMLADLERCARDVQPALTEFIVDESPAVRLLA